MPPSDVRFYRLVARLCRCGDRPVAEPLRELGREEQIEDRVVAKVARYVEALERLGPDALRLLGGDRMPVPPPHLVRPP